MFYSLRIRASKHEKIELVKLFFERYSTGPYLYAWENQFSQENPHLHAVLDTVTKRNTMVSYIKKNFGEGNRYYSLRQAILDEGETIPLRLCAYIIKDGDYVSTFPDTLTELCKKHDKAVKASMREKKKAKQTILAQIEEKYFPKVINTNILDFPNIVMSWDLGVLELSRLTEKQYAEHLRIIEEGGESPYLSEKVITKEYIVDIVVHFYWNNETRLIRKFMLVSLCQTLCLKYIPYYQKELKQELLQSL